MAYEKASAKHSHSNAKNVTAAALGPRSRFCRGASCRASTSAGCLRQQ
jgi:hypothetical protein